MSWLKRLIKRANSEFFWFFLKKELKKKLKKVLDVNLWPPGTHAPNIYKHVYTYVKIPHSHIFEDGSNISCYIKIKGVDKWLIFHVIMFRSSLNIICTISTNLFPLLLMYLEDIFFAQFVKLSRYNSFVINFLFSELILVKVILTPFTVTLLFPLLYA